MDFDLQSKTWDNERRTERARVIAKEIEHAVKNKKNCNAMEFGCGTGLISVYLSQYFKQIACIDSSQGMIDMLNAKIIQNNVKNLTAYCQDINQQQVAAQYDVVFTSMALHHIVELEQTIANLYACLKKDGRICIIELNEDDGSFHKAERDFHGHNGFNQNQLREVLRKIGWVGIKSHTFYYGQKSIEDRNVPYSLFLMTAQK